MHTEESLYSITTASERQFNGTVDGSIAPYGFFPSSAGRSSAVVFIYKQSDAQKQAYRDKDSDMPKVIHHAPNVSFVVPYHLTFLSRSCTIKHLPGCVKHQDELLVSINMHNALQLLNRFAGDCIRLLMLVGSMA